MRTRKRTRVRHLPRAATTDVIGSPPSKPRIRPKWKKHYERLVELREHLINSRKELATDALEERPTFSTHMADAGTYDRDLALSMLSSEQDAVYEIDEAINRIHNGTYGICELTGKQIEPARLEAIPWARFSTGAEQKLEKEGALKRARLGRRDTVTKTEAAERSEETI